MKKLLLSTAVAALIASPALANDGVKLSIGGHAKAYLGYIVDQDTAASVEERTLDIYRETEIHLSGETTLDNGLTVGAHFEMEADEDDNMDVEESYVYFSGDWGRVNFGAEDSAAYLLQVAAPSADSNVDGLRQYISGGLNVTRLDYDQAISGKDEKVTYLSPVFGGAQLGLSYTPESGETDNNIGTNAQENQNDDTGSVYDVALRYEGSMDSVSYTLGAGYTHAELEADAAAAPTRDDRQAFNIGADVDFGAFGLGVVYTEDDMETAGANNEQETWVIGADYTVGAYKLGASYLNQESEVPATTETEDDRFTAGVVYSYGPGMSFRGSVSYRETDTAAADSEVTSVLLGTQINF